MIQAPYVGIGMSNSERVISAGDGQEPYRTPTYVMPAALGEMVELYDGIPQPITPSASKRQILGHAIRLNGLILGGGGDWALFRNDSGARGSSTDKARLMNTDLRRDRAEMLLIKLAKLWGIPTLGICRGAQGINLEAGGNLKNIDHLDHLVTGEGLYSNTHDLHLKFGNPLAQRLYEKIGDKVVRDTISQHHEAANRLGKGYEVVAVSDDEEAIFEIWADKTATMVGAQGHPELQTDHPYSQAILENFFEFANTFVPIASREHLDPEIEQQTEMLLAA